MKNLKMYSFTPYNKTFDIDNPVDCLNLTFEQSISILKMRIGDKNADKAFDIKSFVKSPVCGFENSSWVKTAKIIGINPRITKTYWGIVKYAMSFSENAIHLMPLFESGNGNLYVQNSWNLSKEFLDKELVSLGYDTPSKQLKLVINVLHMMGKIIGFDALAHVDNFSEITLLNPKYFEWVKLNEDKTAQIPYNEIDYNLIYLDIERLIIETLNLPENTFELTECEREKLIFPKDIDRFERRMFLRKVIRNKGYEPIPVVEHSPMRPVIFEKIEKDKSENWAVFKVENKSEFAKIFGAITPYKLYYIDGKGYPLKNEIIEENWQYFAQKIFDFQQEYNFDFLRADMAHNQVSHSHIEKEKDQNPPELWAYVKSCIKEKKPYFATMAEAFLSSYYINGIDDMQNKDFDVVLGNMNFKNLDKEYLNCIDDFLNSFRDNFSFYPCVTVFTNDCDLAENDGYFSSNKQNLLRYFISLFLNLPSYTGIGFELRNIGSKDRAEYTNYYTSKQDVAYCFGNNTEFFKKLSLVRKQYQKLRAVIENASLKMLYSIDNDLSLCFKYVFSDKSWLIVANLNPKNDTITFDERLEYIRTEFLSDNDIFIFKNKSSTKIKIKSYEFGIFEVE